MKTLLKKRRYLETLSTCVFSYIWAFIKNNRTNKHSYSTSTMQILKQRLFVKFLEAYGAFIFKIQPYVLENLINRTYTMY